MKEVITLAALLSQSHSEIITFLKGIYEHSPWVAEGLLVFPESLDANETAKLPIERVVTVGDLSRAMRHVVDSASREKKLELLRAHPDLCCEKVEALSSSSQVEQSRSGLQHTLTEEEKAKFVQLNIQYKAKFGFPFILAVRNATKYTVLSALEGRVNHEVEIEFSAALVQVHKIAWMVRLFEQPPLCQESGSNDKTLRTKCTELYIHCKANLFYIFRLASSRGNSN